jgi:septal ring factor EnvC (AmiA/AmiB activator)
MSCSLGWNGYPLIWGKFVVTGEPFAVMGDGAQSAVAKAGGASQPVLYVEFRKDGIPVDPVNEGQKVRG